MKKNGKRTPQWERISKHQISNQLNAAESANNNGNSTFADPDHAEEDKEEGDEETVAEKIIAPPAEQRAEELTAAKTPPNLHCP